MTSQKNFPFDERPQRCDRRRQPPLILFGVAGVGWTMRTQLAKRKIASQYGEPARTKGFGKTRKKKRLTVGSRTMSQNQTIAFIDGRTMKKAPDRGLRIRLVNEFFNHQHRHFKLRNQCIPKPPCSRSTRL